jgi:hypothetical protein
MKKEIKIIEQSSPYKYCPRFGQIAVELGFITMKQLKEGLIEQVNDDIAHRPHRLLSEILFDKGWITNRQILEVLHELSKVEGELRHLKK